MICTRVLAGVLLLTSYSSFMRAQEHVSEPPVNLGDTSFLDGIGGPGELAETIGDAEHSRAIVDGAGHKVRGTGQVNSILSLTHGAWLSNDRILGGWYGTEVVVAAAHVNAGPGMATGGVGDLVVSPLVLQWPEKKLGQIALDQRFAADFWLPVGDYSPTKSVNISSHTFLANPNYAVTVFPLRRVESSWRVHYLWSSTNQDPPLSANARSTQAGQAVHFNATLSYELAMHLWVGANGYLLKQITDPKINGTDVPNSPEQVGAIGPGMVWNHREWFLYLNAYHELGVENRPTGNKVVVRVQKVFGKKR